MTAQNSFKALKYRHTHPHTPRHSTTPTITPPTHTHTLPRSLSPHQSRRCRSPSRLSSRSSTRLPFRMTWTAYAPETPSPHSLPPGAARKLEDRPPAGGGGRGEGGDGGGVGGVTLPLDWQSAQNLLSSSSSRLARTAWYRSTSFTDLPVMARVPAGAEGGAPSSPPETFASVWR